MDIAGYQVPEKGVGGRGTAYTYVLARNGLFLETDNPLLAARVRVADARVRGLALLLRPQVELKQGRVPGRVLAFAVGSMTASPDIEWYGSISWETSGYRLDMPPQRADGTRVDYVPTPHRLVDIHSHAGHDPFFSPQDDEDEQGLLVSVVLGNLDRPRPRAMARLCAYGYYSPVSLGDIFDSVPAYLEEMTWSTA